MNETTFKPGDIVMWNKISDSHSVKQGALAKVIDNMGEYCLMNIEWIDELSCGQMNGGYFKSDFQLV